jgi:hypothetical protein
MGIGLAVIVFERRAGNIHDALHNAIRIAAPQK